MASTNIHSQITDSAEIHVPKGFTEAQPDTAPVKNANGMLEWRPLNLLGGMGPVGPSGWTMAQVLMVHKTPAANEFASVKLARDYAVMNGCSQNKPFLIKVGPGLFTEPQIAMVPGLGIEGSGEQLTTIAPINTADHLIVGSDYSMISNVALHNVLGTDKAAIFFSSITGTNQSAMWIEGVRFKQNDRHVLIQAISSGQSNLFLNNCKFGGDYQFRQGFVMIGNTTGSAKIILRDCTTSGLTVPYPQDVFYATGPGSQIVANACQFRSTSITSGNLIRLEDGAECRATSINCKNFGTAFNVPNVGGAVHLNAHSVLIEDCSNDIVINHPGTIGTFEGSANSSKVMINPSISGSQFKIQYSDSSLNSVGLVVIGDVSQGTKHADRMNITKLARTASTMGLVDGGQLSVVSGFQIGINSGSGFLYDTAISNVREVSWLSGSITLSANTDEYIYVNPDGSFGNDPIQPDLSNVILLGRVLTGPSGVIFIDSAPMNMNHYGNVVSAWLRTVMGPLAQSGGIVSEVGSRQMSITGMTYYFDAQLRELDAENPVIFTSIYRDGLGGFTYVPSQTVIDNSSYDDGSGTLQPIPAGQYVKHILYGVDDDDTGDKYFVHYAQAYYPSLAAAENAPIPTAPQLRDGVIRIAGIIVQEGGTNFAQNPTDLRPRPGFAAPSSAAASDHGSLSNLNIPAHHPWALWVNGGNQMTAPLNMGTQTLVNYPGKLSKLVTPDVSDTANTIIDIYNHHARHMTGGPDAIPQVTTTVDGLMIAADKVRVNNIETIADARIGLQKAQPNGLATLDGSGRIPANQLTLDIMEYKGAWDSAGNVPFLIDGVGDPGDTYRVSTMGTHDFGHGPIIFGIGDLVVYNGSIWERIPSFQAVQSVNGYTGIVVLTTTDVAEGTNLYYTQTRFNAAFGAKTTSDLAEGTNLYYTQTRFNSAFAAKTTSDLTEGTNLYYTQARFDTAFGGKTTTNLAEGTNLYYTAARFNTAFAGKTTSDLTEGSNLYYTNARADARITAQKGVANGLATLDGSTKIPIAQLPTAVASSLSANSTSTEGTASTVSRSDHTHAIASGAPIQINANGSNDTGTSANFARADHKHDILTAVVIGQTPDQANAAGTSSSLARADHVHNIPTAAAVTLDASSTNTQGAASTFARSNHTHAITTGIVITVGTNIANAAGTGAPLARADHTHHVTVYSDEASATADTTITSGTDTLLSEMTITPPAGTYEVRFSTTFDSNSTGATTSISVYVGGSQVAHSERGGVAQFNIGFGGSSNIRLPIATNCKVTVNGSQAIEIRARRTSGTSTFHQRTLNIIKVD